jgi:hypothetical protein
MRSARIQVTFPGLTRKMTTCNLTRRNCYLPHRSRLATPLFFADFPRAVRHSVVRLIAFVEPCMTNVYMRQEVVDGFRGVVEIFSSDVDGRYGRNDCYQARQPVLPRRSIRRSLSSFQWVYIIGRSNRGSYRHWAVGVAHTPMSRKRYTVSQVLRKYPLPHVFVHLFYRQADHFGGRKHQRVRIFHQSISYLS